VTELNFKGKEFVYNHHLAVPFRPLVPHAEKGIGPVALDGNLIIHGDNLDALKALLPMYAGKVDCIFIDPPYNTGNEGWSYNDNVNAPMIKEWLKANPIGIDDGLRHDKWCAMMWPRLRMLEQLLAPTGIIAITIDDNELERTISLLDEIFQSHNRLAVAAWLSDPSGGKQKSALRVGHEYVVIFGGGDEALRKQDVDERELAETDKYGPYAKGRELLKWGAGSLRSDRETMFFPMKAPDGTLVWPIRNDGRDGRWRVGKDSVLARKISQDPEHALWERRPFDDGVAVNSERERLVPYEKIRDQRRAFGWPTWLDSAGFTADGTRVLKDIFGNAVFETPKPVSLVRWVIELLGSEDIVVLDSFAGSATTAHAVLEANKSDGVERKFILIQMPEKTAEDSLARKCGYDEVIDVTVERVKRVVNGYSFNGTQKSELHRERLHWRTIERATELTHRVQGIENLYGTVQEWYSPDTRHSLKV
jgi:adenine-specific DNA-methyltransferase